MASNSNSRQFKVGDDVVYPLHGVGRITKEEVTTIMGDEIRMYVISFSQDKMVLRIPTTKAEVELRPVSSDNTLEKACEVLTKEARITKGMWSKRQIEYEQKINSGDVSLLGEVLRDLYRRDGDVDRSYSERLIYESALERFTNEYASVKGVSREEATKKIIGFLSDKTLEAA